MVAANIARLQASKPPKDGVSLLAVRTAIEITVTMEAYSRARLVFMSHSFKSFAAGVRG